MKLCIDDANVAKIRKIYEYYPVDGVSTNPSILAKTGRSPYEVLKEIRSIVGDGELFVQAVSPDAEGIVREAHRIIRETGDRTLVKIPCVPEGFKAMKVLKAEGIRFIGTAIYTPMQGILAAKCGAEYVAPYVNRIDNMGFDGIKVSKEIHDAITANGLDHSHYRERTGSQRSAGGKLQEQPTGAGSGQVRRKSCDRGAGCDRRPGEKCRHRCCHRTV